MRSLTSSPPLTFLAVFSLSLTDSLLPLASTTPVAALNPIEIKGYKLFDSITGEEFVVRGIDYYPRPNHGDLNHNSLDLFGETNHSIWERYVFSCASKERKERSRSFFQRHLTFMFPSPCFRSFSRSISFLVLSFNCFRDILYLQELGVNAIRLYAVDPTLNHDAFMCALETAGIYVIVALAHDCPTCAVTKDQAPDCYPPELKLQGQRVINAFAKYPNTLGFSAGNEVNHFAPPGVPEWNAPCQKKFLRDMREYIASCANPHRGMRQVPIGLISADNDREEVAAYYNCQENENDPYQSAEWYGLNAYVSCDGKAEEFDQAPGLRLLALSFINLHYSIPTLLTEFGCLSRTFPDQDGYPSQRDFREAKWILEEPIMREPFNGGFAFEYSIEMENAKSESPYPFDKFGLQNYGVGWFSPELCDDIDTPCEYNPFPSFYNLKKAYEEASVNLNVTSKNVFQVSDLRSGRSQCPERFPRLDSFTWVADKTKSLSCPKPESPMCNIKPGSANATTATATSPILFASKIALFLFVSGMGIIVFVLLTYLVILQRRRNRFGRVPSLLSFPPQRTDSESDVQSHESGGLLSMKKYGDDVEGGSVAGSSDYQAISSDSSQEDLGKYLERKQEQERRHARWHDRR